MHLKDISLTGSITSSDNGRFTLILTEPTGPTFILHYQDKGGHPSKFLYTSNELSGVWTFNGKTLPVELSQESSFNGSLSSRMYADVTNESDEKFEARIQGFKNAVISNDRIGVSQYVDFPLRVNFRSGKTITILNSPELQAEWEVIFSKKWLKAAVASIPHDLFVRQSEAMLGDGIAWFGARGLTTINAD